MSRDRDRDRDRDMEPHGKYFNKDTKVDYKDVPLLQKCCSPQGKLFDRKRLGTNAHQQRKITAAVKRARFLALLRYVAK